MNSSNSVRTCQILLSTAKAKDQRAAQLYARSTRLKKRDLLITGLHLLTCRSAVTGQGTVCQVCTRFCTQSFKQLLRFGMLKAHFASSGASSMTGPTSAAICCSRASKPYRFTALMNAVASLRFSEGGQPLSCTHNILLSDTMRESRGAHSGASQPY